MAQKRRRTWSVVLLALLTVILVMAGLFWYTANAPVLKDTYYEDITTGGPLERQYLQPGSMATKKVTFTAEAPIGSYTVYFPAELASANKAYPMVLVVNGTGFKASMYEPQLKQLASWGFIVVGTEDKNTGTATTTSGTLDYMLALNETPDSVLHRRIDAANVGITGFSQGGAAALRAITAFDNGKVFKTAAALSPVNENTATETSGYPYDISKVKCSLMMLAGTEGDFENKIVIPLPALKSMYDRVPGPKIMARRTGMDHDHMMYSAGGYVTAWFMWQLQGDQEAARAFVGSNAEILNNPLYQDQRTAIR